MRYFYEYKLKNGARVGGHNLEKIEFCDEYLKLIGFEDIDGTCHYDYPFVIILDIKEIEYFKIIPMEIE